MKIKLQSITEQFVDRGTLTTNENALLLFFSNEQNRYKDAQSIAEETGLPKETVEVTTQKLLEKKLIE